MNILRVAIDVPLPKLFDYRAEEATAQDVGLRAVVPFGGKKVLGLIMEVAASSDLPADKLRSAEQILRDMPPLAGAWLELVRFCSEYYQRCIGEVVHAALPPRLRRPARLPAPDTPFALSESGAAALAALPARRRGMRSLLARLAAGPANRSELAALARDARKHLDEAAAAGWVHAAARPRPGFVAAHRLTGEQASAVAAVRGHDGFGTFLLYGVTGSGKTEVYLHAIADALAKGRQALVLVPEIALTPALESAFRQRFPDARLVVQHSAMPELERARGFLAAQSGEADIVLGTRLAVFVPLARPGLVVVDEEQDASFKQQEGLRYSGRDLAIMRARQAGIAAVLCSATPSMESWYRAQAGRYGLLTLSQRAGAATVLPAVRLVDLRAHPAREGISELLERAISARLERGEQVLLFLNRRGYAPVLACPQCGWSSGCPRCSTRLVVHLRQRRLRCHHCGLAARIARACPDCGNLDLAPLGRGTQRLEAALASRFPAARILRMDSDSVASRGRIENELRRIESGDANLLVGTQILAKGHHFARLTLVGVVDGDAGLFAANYRAPERMLQQLEQVAGRAGRAELAGEVIVQTRHPRHPLFQALERHDYPGYARILLEERRQAGFPPFVFEAALRADAAQADSALGFLREAVAMRPRSPSGITTFDPSPMTLERLAGRSRAQVIAQARSRARLQSFLAQWRGALYQRRFPGVRWHIDVDPTEF